MKNVHSRTLDHPIAAVRPWIAQAWSGTDDDVFPRDRIRNWRKNPDGIGPQALVPGVTRVGHGPFAFTLSRWDGDTWRVELPRGQGWHGFELEADGARTRIRHVLDADLGLGFRLFVLPVHDWAVEALLDRLEAALATGRVPARTARPMDLRTRAFFRVDRLTRALRGPRRPTAARS